MSGISIVIILVVVGAFYFILTRNRMVLLRNRVKEAWSDVQVQMKRRYDLIPNLVETVKGYAKHESQTLEEVVKARNMAMQARVDDKSVKDIAETENMLSGALKSIFALTENYPNLKADAHFLELQRELRDTEDKIQAARRFYNGNVLTLNTSVEMFPSNIVASTFGFEKADFFELGEGEEAAKQPVAVKF